MIFITGDVHSKISDLTSRIKNNKIENCVLIVLGDLGFCWDIEGSNKEKVEKVENKIINDFLEKRNIELISVRGNHENHKRILDLSIIEKYGGRLHSFLSNISFFFNGDIYNIDNKKFWVMGGATSTDKSYRRVDISWWAEEIPSAKEFNDGMNNILDNDIDFILTHTAPSDIINEIDPHFRGQINCPVQKYLQHVKDEVNFNSWFFGHMHDNEDYLDKYHLLYDGVKKI